MNNTIPRKYLVTFSNGNEIKTTAFDAVDAIAQCCIIWTNKYPDTEMGEPIDIKAVSETNLSDVIVDVMDKVLNKAKKETKCKN